MSNTLTITDMEALVSIRVPMNLTTSYIDDRIFEAYRWIEQQGAFIWNVVNTDVIVRGGTFYVNPVDMPGVVGGYSAAAPTMDIGKPTMIYGATPGSTGFSIGRFPIPYVAPDQLALHELYHVIPAAGFFSCFTIEVNAASLGFILATPAPWPQSTPYIQFAPSNAAPPLPTPANDLAFHCIYHQQPILTRANFGSAQFFPTPDAFDDLIVNLAVAFTKEMYNLAGASDAVQKSQAQIANLLDHYRSNKRYMEGLMAETSETQETQLKKAE